MFELVDLLAVLLDSDRVRRISFWPFLVRNWCVQAGIRFRVSDALRLLGEKPSRSLIYACSSHVFG
jgi:hypothetical protein